MWLYRKSPISIILITVVQSSGRAHWSNCALKRSIAARPGVFCRKWPIEIRHRMAYRIFAILYMHLRYPVHGSSLSCTCIFAILYQEMTYRDKTSYGSSLSCTYVNRCKICQSMKHIHAKTNVSQVTCVATIWESGKLIKHQEIGCLFKYES